MCLYRQPLENRLAAAGTRRQARQVPHDLAGVRGSRSFVTAVIRATLPSSARPKFLASADDGKVALITAVTKDLLPRLHAGKIVQELAKLVGGSGGGRPDLAEAGGKDTSAIESTIVQVPSLLDRLL